MEERRRVLTLEERRERQAREAARRRKKRRQKRQRKRFLLLAVCLAALLFGAGLARNGGKGKKTQTAAAGNEDQARMASGRQEDALASELPDIGAVYGIFVNGAGWSHFFADDSYCMAPSDQYVTAFRATLNNQPYGMTGTVSYRVNLSGSGWQDWQEDGAEAGMSAGQMPLESIAMRLTGQLETHYDILYSVLQNQSWTDWVMNGEEAGQSGVGLRVDGIRISVTKKREGMPSWAGGIDPSKPMVALTYDDGPSLATLRILEVLKEYDGRATFFMVGKQVEKHMDVVKKVADQGCEIGNHTYDHVAMTKEDPAALTDQLVRTNQVVSDACGIAPVLMRPVGGARNDAGLHVAGAISMPAVFWSVDTLDWKTRDAQTTIETVLSQVSDGDIILMHDLYDATAQASETLIPELTKRGFQLVTVSELSSYRGGMIPGKTYGRFRPVS